jgi:hypothetical protein
MKTFLSFSAFTLMLAVLSCQSGEKSTDSGMAYYRQLRFSETPFDPFTGNHEISADEAEKVNHYRFTYDEESRPISLEYMRGNELLKGSSTGVSKIKITYDVNKEIHHFFDHNGEPIKWAGAFAAVYELDENGTRKGLRFLDSEGKPTENRNGIARFEWEIMPTEQVREKRYNLNGEETVLNEFCPFYELRFTYDDKGWVRNMANYQGDTMYNCTVENCGDIGVSFFAFDYNDAGDLTSFTVRSLTGQLSNLYWGWARFENEYDEYGNVIERAMFDQDDEPLAGRSVPVTQMVYNEQGALVERKNMDIHRNLINDPQSGVSVIRYVYDESGLPSDTLSFNNKMAALDGKSS